MPERGGPSARGGFLYQDLVTAEVLLELLTGSGNITSVIVEAPCPVGDLVVYRKEQPTQYVQVKGRGPRGKWTVSSLHKEDFWNSIIKQMEYDPLGEVMLVCESTVFPLSELVFRAHNTKKIEEFTQNVEKTSSLRVEFTRLCSCTNLGTVELKGLLEKLVIRESHGSCEEIRRKLIESIEGANGDIFLSILLDVISEAAIKREHLTQENLRRTLSRKGIGAISIRRQLVAEPLDEIAARSRENIQRIVATKLGTKYIEGLFVKRQIEGELNSRLAWNLEKTADSIRRILGEVRQLHILDPNEKRKQEQTKTALENLLIDVQNGVDQEWRAVIKSMEKLVGGTWRGDLDIVKQLKETVLNVDAIVAKAGIGKTNLAASLALHSAGHNIVCLLLSDELYLERENSIGERIKEQVGLKTDVDFCDFVRQVNPALRRERRKIVIIIDAVNESPNYILLKKNLEYLSYGTLGQEVVICITCRDIFWSGFFFNESESFAQLLRKTHLMKSFTDSEFRAAWVKYCNQFHLHVNRMSSSVAMALHHPLLLRFFCETYGSRTGEAVEIAGVSDIRLKKMFDEYLSKKSQMIKLKLHHRTTVQIENTLMELARRMLHTRERWLEIGKFDELGDRSTIESVDSLYVALLDEDVIIERAVSLAGKIMVTFVYEEFMEYMMARATFNELYGLPDNDIRVQLTTTMQKPPASMNFHGMLRYLAIFLKENRAMSVWYDLVTTNQAWCLHALRSLQQIDIKLWDKSAADTVPLVARIQLSVRNPVGAEELLELCSRSLRRYPQELVDTLKCLICLKPPATELWGYYDVRNDAVRLLVRLAKQKKYPQAGRALNELFEAAKSVIELFEKDLGIRFDVDTHALIERADTTEVLGELIDSLSGKGVDGMLALEVFGGEVLRK
jgi:hypothetical protein